MYSSTLPSTSALDGGGVVNATHRPLYQRERPGNHCIGGWVGPRAGLDGCGKSRPHRDSIPGATSPQGVTIPTELSGKQKNSDINEFYYHFVCHKYHFEGPGIETRLLTFSILSVLVYNIYFANFVFLIPLCSLHTLFYRHILYLFSPFFPYTTSINHRNFRITYFNTRSYNFFFLHINGYFYIKVI